MSALPRCLPLLLVLMLPANALAELDISDARIKNLPPTVPVRAGYMTIHNPTQATVNIVAVRSEAFASVELHRSLMQDGMMRMEPVDSLQLGPGETLQLVPGGLHLMMMRPVEPTRPGAEIGVVLELGDGAKQAVMMKVIK